MLVVELENEEIQLDGARAALNKSKPLHALDVWTCGTDVTAQARKKTTLDHLADMILHR
jgi:hypothetical protein